MSTDRFPYVRVRFQGKDFTGEEDALLDTGFDGYLAVPEAVAAQWPQPVYVDRVRTASGEIVHVPVFIGYLEFIDRPGPFEALIISIGDEFLVGLASIKPFKVTFDHGLRVLIEE